MTSILDHKIYLTLDWLYQLNHIVGRLKSNEPVLQGQTHLNYF